MPIRINLLAEAQAAAELRRKDPVKRGIWIGSFVVCVVLIWIGNLEWKVILEKHDFSRADAEWKSNQAKYSAVTNEQFKIMDVDAKLGLLDKLSTNRFLWAPVLNALQQTMVDDVQVTRLKGEQTMTKEDKPPAVIEKISLRIEARDLKPVNENYNSYKKSLSTFDFFAKFPKWEGFVMDGTLSQITVDPVDPNQQFITFALAAQFPEEEHRE